MDIVKLKPAIKDYIWGGETLKRWGKESMSDRIAECWELSFNPEGPSIIASGPYAGTPLKDVAQKDDIGSLPASFAFFPVLVKLIDAASDLSVQVHPGDEFALKNEGQYGKTEMWYVIEAAPGAGLYVGFKRKTSAEEVRKAIADDSLMGLLSFHKVKPKDSLFIPAGTVHAIGAGVTLLEIQQNSTLTYRLYDYHRLGSDGQPRELHLEKALRVLDFGPYQKPEFPKPVIGECHYFSASVHAAAKEKAIHAPDNSFASVTFVAGSGIFAGLPYRKGDTFFIPAAKAGALQGKGTFITTTLVCH